ncbi:MAG: sensor histidine kinase [Maricaulaceae bacterium]
MSDLPRRLSANTAPTPPEDSGRSEFARMREARDLRRHVLTMTVLGVCVIIGLALLGGAGGWASLGAAAVLASLSALYYLTSSWPRRLTPAVGAGSGVGASVGMGVGVAAFATPDREAQIISRMLDAAPEPILRVDAEGVVVYANQAAKAAFAVEPGRSFLVTVIRQPVLAAVVEAARAGGGAATGHYIQPGAVESHIRVHAVSVGVDTPDDDVMVALIDETDARRAAQTRADFMANASHELRTPLASLSGFIETLRGHAKDDPEARDHFLSIMDLQAARMRRLIDDLLSLSRVELDEHLRPTEVCDLAALAADGVDALSPVARKAGVSLVLSPTDQPMLVTGSRDQLAQVIQNLLDNAIKYSQPEGRVRLTVNAGLDARAAARPPDGLGEEAERLCMAPLRGEPAPAYARLEVKDDGVGVPGRHLPRLAERFYRVDETVSRERGGTGLGLAIVKHIVARHRGVLSVESAPGTGTVFAVALPQAPQSGRERPAA